jgi:hypothetical protein
LTRRRASIAVRSTSIATPAARSQSATATGRSEGTTALSISQRRSARVTTSSSASSRRLPSPIRSNSPSSSNVASSASGSASASRAASSELDMTNASPSRAANRTGSMISSGISWRSAG